MSASYTSFSEQLRTCRAENMIDNENGPEVEMDPLFPTKKFLEYVQEHGCPPKFKLPLCKRFGGNCSSGNVECRKLRGITT